MPINLFRTLTIENHGHSGPLKRPLTLDDNDLAYSKNSRARAVSVGDGKLMVSLADDDFGKIDVEINVPQHGIYKSNGVNLKNVPIFHEVEFSSLDEDAMNSLEDDVDHACQGIYARMIQGGEESRAQAVQLLKAELDRVQHEGDSEEKVVRAGLMAQFMASCLKRCFSDINSLPGSKKMEKIKTMKFEVDSVQIEYGGDWSEKRASLMRLFNLASDFQKHVCLAAKACALAQINGGMSGKAFRSAEDECLQMFLGRLEKYQTAGDEMRQIILGQKMASG